MKKTKHVLIVLGCSPKRNGKPSDCMIQRARKAVQLFKRNNYSTIILSGGTTRRGCPPEAAIMRVMLLNHLPQEKVLSEIRSRNAVQNALFCWELIKGADPKSVTILTSRMNLKRIEYVFTKLYEHMGVKLRFEAADDTNDPVEHVYYWLREIMARMYYRVFGIR